MTKKTLRSAVIASTPALLLASGLAHAVEFQAGNTTFSVEGYAKLDMIYDFDDRLGRFTFHDQIGADSSDGHFRMQAGQSRIGFRSVTETDQGPLVLFANMDFFDGDAARTGSNSGGNPRLREVYGQWNGITAGRTWTTFNTFVGTPETLDFTNAVGQAGLDLQTQLRYTVGGFSIALEAPDDLVSSLNGSAIANAGGQRSSTFGASNQSKLPDLTMNYHWTQDSVDFAVGAMVRQLRVGRGDPDVDVGNSLETSDTATGWGLFGAASTEIAPGTTVRGVVAGGDGIGNYLYFQPAPAAYFDPNREKIETIEAVGGSASITQEIGPGRATLAYAYAYADNEDFYRDVEISNDDLFLAGHKFQSIIVNYLWEPIERVTYGIELGWHRVDRLRKFENGERVERSSDDDAYRIMTSLIYDF